MPQSIYLSNEYNWAEARAEPVPDYDLSGVPPLHSSAPTSLHLARRLAADNDLDAEASAALGALAGRTRKFAKASDILNEGDRADKLYLVIDGWACRYRSLSDGTRQITGFVIPGDFCNPEHLHVGRSDYAVSAISQLEVTIHRKDKIETLAELHGSLRALLLSDILSVSRRERDWLLNVGQRSALERVAHLLCELVDRLDRVGLVQGQTCCLPITQYDIGAATGLSAIHVNRTLRDLRDRGLAELKGRRLQLLDLPGLQALCLFDPPGMRAG